MMDSTQWKNYALITYLARQSKNGKNLGKTKLQKLVYFLKTVKKLPLDYTYRFYTYGPYCDELAGDISYLSAIKAINVSLCSNGFGYEIHPGPKADFLEKKAASFLEEYQSEIDDITDQLLNKSAREMELLSTILYLFRNDETCYTDKNTLLKRVEELKPHFDTTEIKSGLNELVCLKYLVDDAPIN